MDNSSIDLLIPWFQLRSIPGIGNLLYRRLIDRFKSPENVFAASLDEIVSVEGVTKKLAVLIKESRLFDSVKRELDLIADKNYGIITLNHRNYPALLARIPDPPPFLYIYGSLGDTARSIAIVGSRSATGYGIATAKNLGRELASLKITVVSGMARGIDTAAHMGALEGKGKTIAVLGSGLERVYPSENIKLFHDIAESGAVISEFSLMAAPEPHHFPIRNRIISGLSLGTVVVEASKKSGSLITARLAGEQNREVFAVPGNIRSFKSAGTHSLIKQGAKLVENVRDILEELPHVLKSHMADNKNVREDVLKAMPAMNEDELKIFRLLGPYPVHIDDIVRKAGMDPGEISGILLQLELKGIVTQSPGKMFSMEIDRLFPQ